MPHHVIQKTYAFLLFVFSVTAAFALFLTGTFDSVATSFRHGVFHVISVMTTTGYTTDPFYAWPSIVPLLLIFVAFIGGCAGSTAGGMKIIRVILLQRQALREIRLLIHPHAESAAAFRARSTDVMLSSRQIGVRRRRASVAWS